QAVDDVEQFGHRHGRVTHNELQARQGEYVANRVTAHRQRVPLVVDEGGDIAVPVHRHELFTAVADAHIEASGQRALQRLHERGLGSDTHLGLVQTVPGVQIDHQTAVA